MTKEQNRIVRNRFRENINVGNKAKQGKQYQQIKYYPYFNKAKINMPSERQL